MRQSQQHRRNRGRTNNNNRKGQNPLTRSYESNGPDVKIRGTPSHIAEKYVAMARDALSSGDPVLAENYLQHAEHYNRIIMAYREQQGGHTNDHGGGSTHGSQRLLSDDDQDYDDPTFRFDSPSPPGSEPQPSVQMGHDESNDRPRRRHRDRDGGQYDERSQERSQERGQDRNQDRPQQERPQQERSSAGRGRNRRRYAQTDDQPEFLKRPVRQLRGSDDGDGERETVVKSDEAAE